MSRGFFIAILCLCLLAPAARAADPLLADGPILAALPAVDQMPLPGPAASLLPACGPERLVCPPSNLGGTLMVGSAGTGLLLGSAVLGAAAGALLPAWQMHSVGRPDPLVTTLGLGVGLGVTVAASQLLVPLAAPLGNDAGYAVAVSEARLASWRSSRWAVLAGGVGFAALAVGAGLERREFGSGQALMGAGGATLLLSGLVYMGLELAGVVHASQAARRPRG